jgi:hypothetical protein
VFGREVFGFWRSRSLRRLGLAYWDPLDSFVRATLRRGDWRRIGLFGLAFGGSNPRSV